MTKEKTPTGTFVYLYSIDDLREICKYLERDGFLWKGGQKPTEWEPSKFNQSHLQIYSDNTIALRPPSPTNEVWTLEYFLYQVGWDTKDSKHSYAITNPIKAGYEVVNPHPKFEKQLLVQSKEEYDNLMLYLESIGYKWQHGNKPTEWTPVQAGSRSKYDFVVELNSWGKMYHDEAVFVFQYQTATDFLMEVGWFPKESPEGQKEVKVSKLVKRGDVSKGTARFTEGIKVNTQQEMSDLMNFLHSQGHKWSSGSSLIGDDFKRKAPDVICALDGVVLYGGVTTITAEKFLTEVGFYDSLLQQKEKEMVSIGIKPNPTVGPKSGLVSRAANYAFVNPFKKSWNFAGKALPFAIFYGTILGASYAGWSVYQNPAEIGKKIQEALPFEVKFKTENNSQE